MIKVAIDTKRDHYYDSANVYSREMAEINKYSKWIDSKIDHNPKVHHDLPGNPEVTFKVDNVNNLLLTSEQLILEIKSQYADNHIHITEYVIMKYLQRHYYNVLNEFLVKKAHDRAKLYDKLILKGVKENA